MMKCGKVVTALRYSEHESYFIQTKDEAKNDICGSTLVDL